MANITISYGTPTAIGITLTSLASSATAGQASDPIVNSNSYLDALVFVKTKASGAPGNDKCMYVYAYGSLDEASPQYPDRVPGWNSAVTFDNPTQLRLIGIVSIPGSACPIRPVRSAWPRRLAACSRSGGASRSGTIAAWRCPRPRVITT